MVHVLAEFRSTVVRKSVILDFKTSYEDPLKRLRRNFYKPVPWTPEVDKVNPKVLEFLGEFSADVLFSFHEAKNCECILRPRNNLSTPDHWAQQWLRENRHRLIDVPTDKNLGCAVVKRESYNDQMHARLNECYVEIQYNDVASVVSSVKSQAIEVLDFASDFKVLHAKQVDYCKCLFENYKMPIARQLVKVHKNPVSTRLLAASTRWITNPLAILLAMFLQPIINFWNSVASDTMDVITNMRDQDFSEGRKNMATFDVDKLYPSLDPAQVLISCRRLAIQFFSSKQTRNWGVLVEVLVTLLDIVLHAQVVRFCKLHADGTSTTHFYLQISGITTGLSCACQIANLHLVGMDNFVKDSLCRQIFAYKRFIDDILIVYSSDITVESIPELLNQFEPGIKVTHEEEDPHRVDFLDVTFIIHDKHLRHVTYRKKLNAYAYTPANSCHPDSVFCAIIATEFIRLRRTCSHTSDFVKPKYCSSLTN